MRNDSTRGMVKYAPYQSLVEQGKALAKMRYERQNIEKKHLSNDAAEEINEILTHYDGEEITLTYFRAGRIYEEHGTIERIDVYRKILVINGIDVALSSLQSLCRKSSRAARV